MRTPSSGACKSVTNRLGGRLRGPLEKPFREEEEAI